MICFPNEFSIPILILMITCPPYESICLDEDTSLVCADKSVEGFENTMKNLNCKAEISINQFNLLFSLE